MSLLQTSTLLLTALLGALSLLACGDHDAPVTTATPLPAEVTITQAALYPEGIDYDVERARFVIGSFRRGEVGTVDPTTGIYTVLVEDDRLFSATGVYVDASRNRLIVAGADAGLSDRSAADGSTAGTIAYLGIYDLASGERIAGVDLKPLTPNGGAFPNDIALGPDGTIYVTDSFSPVIYAVDPDDFGASVFLDGGSRLAPSPGAFGLNGLVATGGALVTVKTDDGTLWRVPLDEPNAFAQIITDTLAGGDGLELDTDGNLVVVQNGLTPNAGVTVLASQDGFRSVTVASRASSTAEAFPTTAVATPDSNVYVLESQLGRTLAGDFTAGTFTIRRL